jgi:YidC/Oxa1 family membrane protein insertase
MFKKFQNIIVTVSLAILIYSGTRLLVSYWRGTPAPDSESVDFIAPDASQVVKPLNKEIDFIDEKRQEPATLTTVQAEWGELTFSSDGASLERLVLKHPVDGKIHEINTVFPVADTEREKRCFLVGLEEKTPYFYQLVAHEKIELGAFGSRVVYRAETDQAIITKTFIVHQAVHKVDLVLEVEPKNSAKNGELAGIEPRIFFPAPFMPQLGKKEAISGLVIDKSGEFKFTDKQSLDLQRGFVAPQLFGTADKYCVHALIGDRNFVQRAYYHGIDESLFAVAQGPLVQEKTVWQLSFYMGPKEANSLTRVDARLENALGYTGMLAPVARLLLKALQWLHDYCGNYGWAIILLIILMQLVMVPFTLNGEKSAKKTREYQRKMAYIEQRYRHDPNALAQERAELIKKHGMPGLGGCLPVLFFRMPVFFALSQVLNGAIELYQAPFLWISDLSATDPYYILPVLVMAGMLVQALTVDASQRMSFIMLAFVIGGVATSFSAGLALYIAVSTLLGVMQTALVRFFKLA